MRPALTSICAYKRRSRQPLHPAGCSCMHGRARATALGVDVPSQAAIPSQAFAGPGVCRERACARAITPPLVIDRLRACTRVTSASCVWSQWCWDRDMVVNTSTYHDVGTLLARLLLHRTHSCSCSAGARGMGVRVLRWKSLEDMWAGRRCVLGRANVCASSRRTPRGRSKRAR